MEIAKEKMTEAFMSVVFEKLLDHLPSLITSNSVDSKLKMLPEKLKKVRLFLEDAEDRQLSDKKVKEWLDDLKHVVFMAEDWAEQIHNSKKEKTSKKRKADYFIGFVKSVSVSVYHSLAKTDEGKIDLIRELEGLYDRARDLKLASTEDPNRRASPPIVTPWREECHVYGRDAEKEEILEMLLSKEDKMIVLPIVGMGGLGKTTLAQLVYNDNRVETHFSLKAWVHVSTKFDFCRIMKELLQKSNSETSSSDPNELQQLMQKALRGKRFLFVLDDVWDLNSNNWDLLKSNFTARGRVIVTTRSGDVGSMVKTGRIHELKEVQKVDCWSIFVHHAFNGDTNADPQLQAIGRLIVEKCKGLPLAIRCIGGLLHSERSPQKWKNILRSDLGDWSKFIDNSVLPSLWLSYRYLSSTQKQCFAYCSLFPQDYRFNKKRMVLWWMAEGFIRSNEEGKSMEEVGEEYFDDLVSRSLFQRSSEDDDTYVVHDLVHYLAAFVYGNFCLRVGDDLKEVSIRTRNLTYNHDVSSGKLLTILSTSKHLRTLMDIQPYLDRVRLDDIVKEMVLKAGCLRVVSLCLKSSVLCHSLGDLKMLRYLNLTGSEIKELPDSICSLFHLQTLILSWCENLTQLPADLPGKLSKLRYLDTIGTRLTKMPPKMGSLQELRILTDFVLGDGNGSDCSTLKELGELHHLGGKLRISKLQNVDNLEDVQKANLRDKVEMKELCLEWEGNDTSTIILAVRVLDALQPYDNLEKLEVWSYPGLSFPKWVGESSFSKMVYLKLNGIYTSLCRFLPPLWQLPSLRELHIEWFTGVEEIGNEFFYGNESGCFPSLRDLHISKCPKLKSIIREDIYGQHWPSLRKFTIDECPVLERRYHRHEGDHWNYISHIPEIYIRGPTTDELEREE